METNGRSGNELLVVEDVKKYFPITRGIIFQKEIAAVKAVDGVSFSINPGETLGIVGESGCGKSTLARCIMKLLETTEGRVTFEGRDITKLSRAAMRPIRREMTMIFQDPYASLNPRMRIAQIIAEPLVTNETVGRGEVRRRVHRETQVGPANRCGLDRLHDDEPRIAADERRDVLTVVRIRIGPRTLRKQPAIGTREIDLRPAEEHAGTTVEHPAVAPIDAIDRARAPTGGDAETPSRQRDAALPRADGRALETEDFDRRHARERIRVVQRVVFHRNECLDRGSARHIDVISSLPCPARLELDRVPA